MTARSSWKTHFLPGAAAATVICTFGSGHGCTGDTYGQPGGRDNDRAGHCAQRGESARSQHSRSRKHGSPGKHAPKSPLSFVKRKVKINSPFNPSGVTQGTGVRGLSDGCRRGWLCPSFSSVLYLDAPRLPPGMPARSPGGRALDRAFPECRGGEHFRFLWLCPVAASGVAAIGCAHPGLLPLPVPKAPSSCPDLNASLGSF